VDLTNKVKVDDYLDQVDKTTATQTSTRNSQSPGKARNKDSNNTILLPCQNERDDLLVPGL